MARRFVCVLLNLVPFNFGAKKGKNEGLFNLYRVIFISHQIIQVIERQIEWRSEMSHVKIFRQMGIWEYMLNVTANCISFRCAAIGGDAFKRDFVLHTYDKLRFLLRCLHKIFIVWFWVFSLLVRPKCLFCSNIGGTNYNNIHNGVITVCRSYILYRFCWWENHLLA